MRVVFMGSPEFAIPTLDRLIQLGKRPLAIFCQPDRPAGRGQKLRSPATKLYGEQHKMTVHQPEKLDAQALQIFKDLKPDLAVVLAYGKILKQTFLDTPRFGCVNLHASILPHLRGAAPIQWSLLRGDRMTGMTLQKMSSELDAGPILLKKEIPIRTMNLGELTSTLSLLAADTIEAFFRSWDGQSPLLGIAQDHSMATFAPKIDASTRLIDWNLTSEEVLNKIRAFAPEPGARTCDETGAVFQILEARPASELLPPGSVSVQGTRALVGTRDQSVELVTIKAPGGRALPVSEYLRGHQLPLAFHSKG